MHRPGKEGERVDWAAEAACALQQLRNSVKNANVRVGGGEKKRQTLDAVKSSPCVTPFATSASEPSLSDTGGDTEREGDGTKPGLNEAVVTKKQQQQPEKNSPWARTAQ